MTQINSIEDLVRVLRDNPEWTETLRGILLTRELLELPETFASHVKRTDDRFRELAEAITQLSTSVDARFAEMAEAITQLSNSVDVRFAQVDARFDRVEGRLDRIENSLGILLGAHARASAPQEADFIVEGLGLDHVRDLTRRDLRQLTRENDISALAPNDVQSFRRADLVIEAEDSQGETAYVAVEISHTVDSSDTGRADRNARWLTMFTGSPARAVVAGIRRHPTADPLIASGQVTWYELPVHILDVE